MNNNFIEIPVNTKSLLARKSIFGIGVNDADYIVSSFVGGKTKMCNYYSVWKEMIRRCYSKSFHERRPTYSACSVCQEWINFMNFKNWMIKQDWQGKELDKDILVKGNKVYSPETCLFVTSAINNLLHDRESLRGKHPQGVNKHKNKFRALCRINGKKKHIGLYASEQLAHEAYKNFKYKVISELAINQQEPLKSALLNYRL